MTMDYFNKESGKRLKERFRQSQLEGFSNSEVLELLLSFAIPGKDVKPVARELMKKFNGLRGILDAAPEELKGIKGVGNNAATIIKVVKSLSGLYLRERIEGRDVIKSPKDVIDYLKAALSGERVEKFLGIYLNSRNEIISVDTLQEGTLNRTIVYPRKAIEQAFKHNACSVIFVHNHPSGNPEPSQADHQLMRMLERAAHAVDLIVLDHIVIGKNSHFSAKNGGWTSVSPSHFSKAAEKPGKF